jgi:hypothetical protein
MEQVIINFRQQVKDAQEFMKATGMGSNEVVKDKEGNWYYKNEKTGMKERNFIECKARFYSADESLNKLLGKSEPDDDDFEWVMISIDLDDIVSFNPAENDRDSTIMFSCGEKLTINLDYSKLKSLLI